MSELKLEDAVLVPKTEADVAAESQVSEKEQYARTLAQQCVVKFRQIYPEYLSLIDSITGTDAKKILRYGFRMPFLQEPASFNRPELDKLYALSLQIRELQDVMVVVGGVLGDSDLSTAPAVAEAAALATETHQANEETKGE